MPVKTGVTIQGGRQFRASAKRAGEDLSELKEAHAAAAGIVVPVAREGMPDLTGRSKATVRPGATKRESIIRAGNKTVRWAGVNEFGWPARNIAAQPAIVPAAKETEPRWIPVFEAALERVINRIKGA